jgi:hypothetical protein
MGTVTGPTPAGHMVAGSVADPEADRATAPTVSRIRAATFDIRHGLGWTDSTWPGRSSPPTATARHWLAAGLGRSWSASQAPMAPASASASRRTRVRRMVASAGTAKWSGASRQAPSAARIGWDASATYSAIAAIDRAPASTAAAAMARMAPKGWRRPRVARGSGTAAR